MPDNQIEVVSGPAKARQSLTNKSASFTFELRLKTIGNTYQRLELRSALGKLGQGKYTEMAKEFPEQIRKI
ncbi:hypothetical protein BGZ70_006313 [Mortierella alpina]|uniref:Uncharacterized protein n=1 Tax=Mortierella alpina TaxID=64518 RepID=A0A9P6J7Z1_MORAP|nr:hypothetical protein BGZ70_006313 [Mortierella alpina]